MEYLFWATLLLILWRRQNRPNLGELSPRFTPQFVPVDQTVSGVDKYGRVQGNCFPACVASLLGLPLEEVPFFTTSSQAAQINDANRWLRHLGFKLVMESWQPGCAEGYHMLRGKSPRYDGYFHMVVGHGDQVVHDPHPDKTGLAGLPTHVIRLIQVY